MRFAWQMFRFVKRLFNIHDPSASLEQSLSELKAMRQNKIKKHTWKEFRKELDEEPYD
ncbi:hypothetical protein [Desulfosporosinus hippei]|nr:hypothetical protein [Desulfosporosinus hippei]